MQYRNYSEGGLFSANFQKGTAQVLLEGNSDFHSNDMYIMIS